MARVVLRKQPSPPPVPAPTWQARLTDAILTRRWALVALAALTGLLLSLIFAPHNLWPLAYVCLVPWLLGVILSQRRATMFLVSYGMGVLFFYFNLNWLWPVTVWPPGGVFGIPLPIGTLLLGLYLGMYLPLAAWLIRFAYRRAHLPLALAVPLVWVATEFVRAYLPAVPYDARWQYTGLQWFFLGHSHYNVAPMIQIADLAGAYGVSFLIAAVNGCLTELLIHRQAWPGLTLRPRRLRGITAVVAAAAALTLAYGLVQLHRDTLQPGPRIAIVQTDQPLTVDDGFGIGSGDIDRTLWQLLEEAVHQDPRPDIVVLPESMWPWRLNREFREMVVPDSEATPTTRMEKAEQALARHDHERLRKLAADFQTTIVVGALSLERRFDKPAAFKTRKYNSVLVYRPGEDEPRRYDKMHLVLFGEFIPFRGGHLHWLYNRLNDVMPWTQEYSLTAGSQARVFETPSASGRTYRFGAPICYEITMSDACRRLSYGPAGKRADLLVNLSNDGWFFYRSELPQHLAIAVFRAVENRVGLVRAVNTGISAAIDPKGRILKAMLAADGQWRRPALPRLVGGQWQAPAWPYQGLSGVLTAQVPVDPTITLYMRWGNWLPIGCLIASAALLLAWWVDRTWIAVRHIRRGGHDRSAA